MTEALLWFLLIYGSSFRTGPEIHPIPYGVEWECEKVGDEIEAESHDLLRTMCFSSSAIDVNAWNSSQAGKWKFTEYE